MHGAETALYAIREHIERHEPDMALLAGDITHFGPPEWARGFLDALPVDTMAIPGNCDPPEVIDAIEESRATCIHMRHVERDGIVFVGLGGSSPTPFPTLLQNTEEEIEDTLGRRMRSRAVLVTHSPPLGHLDKTFIGTHVGSRAILDIVERYRPLLVVSGHIHEARGIDRDEHTVFVNPGKAARGYAALVDIEDRVKATLLSRHG